MTLVMPSGKPSPESTSPVPDFRVELADVINPYRGDRSALITVLQRVQEKLGYLPEAAIAEVARAMRLSKSEVYGVATFYNFFRLKPVGARLVSVCRGTACHVRGGPRILEAVKKNLGLSEGETTPDLKYSLETVACIGACALAPNMVINTETYGRLTTKKVAEIFSQE